MASGRDPDRALRRLRRRLRRIWRDRRLLLRRFWSGLRRLERREVASARRWLEDTENLLHLSVLLFVPASVALVTWLATETPSLSFLLFPPLASGAYTLFAHPESRYAEPVRFVVGMTVGAVCGWIALATVGAPAGGEVSATAAGLAVLLTGGATWLLHVEEPASFAVALLLLAQETSPASYVASVVIASGIVALAYEAWHGGFYEHRAELLYASTGTDDDVLVPMVQGAEPVASLAAHLAAGYDQGRVVLLGIAAPEDADAEPRPDGGAGGEPRADGNTGESPKADDDENVADDDAAGDRAADEPSSAIADGPSAREALVTRLETRARELEAATGTTVEVVVGAGTDETAVTLEATRETGCDLVLAPLDGDGTASFATSLFVPDLDVAAAEVAGERWTEVLVPIRTAGALAHRKIDLARHLAGPDGRVTVAHCIDSEADRRHAEEICANAVDPYDGRFETLVARATIDDFLVDHARANDLVVLGASTDRSRVSRLLSRPTYERVTGLPTDLLVVHSGRQ